MTLILHFPASIQLPAEGETADLPPGSKLSNRGGTGARQVSAPAGQFHVGQFVPAQGSPITSTIGAAINYIAGGIPVESVPVYPGMAFGAAFVAGCTALGNYFSTVAEIESVEREIALNGGAFQVIDEEAIDQIYSTGDNPRIRAMVRDTAGTRRPFPSESGVPVTVLPLPVPVVSAAPVITGGAFVGQTVTYTNATWQAVPATPAGMQRQTEIRFTLNGVVATMPLTAPDEGDNLRVEMRARHALNGRPGVFSDWSQSAPVVVGPVVSAGPVDPVLTLEDQIPGSNGQKDAVPIVFDYNGADIVDIHVATGLTVGFAITAEQLEAGSGGAGVDFASFFNYTGGDVDLTGFVNDEVVELAVIAVERNNGGASAIARIALIDVDFTPPAVTSIATDAIAGSQVILTISEDIILGAEDPTDWTVPGHTVEAVSIVGGTITLGITPAINPGEIDTLTYAGGDLTDSRGYPLAAFSGAAIENRLEASAVGDIVFISSNGGGTTTIESDGTQTHTFASPIPAAGTYLIGLGSKTSMSGEADISIEVENNIDSATEILQAGTLGAQVQFFLVQANAAGPLKIRNNSVHDSNGRILVVTQMDGTTLDDLLSAVASANNTSSQASVVIPGVTAGRVVIAVAAYSDVGVSGITAAAGGSFSSSDEKSENFNTSRQLLVSSAIKVVPATGDFTAAISQAGGDSSYHWAIAALALKAV